MSQAAFHQDRDILWLAITKIGNPPVWTPNTVYEVGDVIVPTNPQMGQENLAFQCVGFIGQSASSPPVFPLSVGSTVVDGGIELKAIDPSADPVTLPYNKYYVLTDSVVII